MKILVFFLSFKTFVNICQENDFQNSFQALKVHQVTFIFVIFETQN